MSPIGWIFVGLLAGVLVDRGAAWVAATARIVDLKEEHQRDLDRVAAVQRFREEALHRGLDPDHAELNAWQELRKRQAPKDTKVLRMQPRRERR